MDQSENDAFETQAESETTIVTELHYVVNCNQVHEMIVGSDERVSLFAIATAAVRFAIATVVVRFAIATAAVRFANVTAAVLVAIAAVVLRFAIATGAVVAAIVTAAADRFLTLVASCWMGLFDQKKTESPLVAVMNDVHCIWDPRMVSETRTGLK